MKNFCLFAVVSTFSCALMGAHAQTQQIAFIGEDFIAQWGQSPQFQAHSNWKAYPNQYGSGYYLSALGTEESLTTLQQIIASGQKPIIMVDTGKSDLDFITPGNNSAIAMAEFAIGMKEIITTAQQAKLTIIVGTVPWAPIGDTGPANKWLMLYCAAHNVPMVNYDFALNSGTGFAASGHGPSQPEGSTPAVPQKPVYYAQPSSNADDIPVPQLTSQAFDLVTDMAETAILLARGGTLRSGYLQNVAYNHVEDAQSAADDNQVSNNGIVQFTPYGQYSDGSTHIINNADVYGHVGTWTSSNPIALMIDQYGAATALAGGSTNIHFTTLGGATISEWTQTTTVWDPCGGCLEY